MSKNIFHEKIKNKILLISLVLLGFLGYSFFWKMFPSNEGYWPIEGTANLEEVPTYGMEENKFWLNLDFPGSQDVCIEIRAEGLSDIKTLPVTQTIRVNLYNKPGNLADFFRGNTEEIVKENLINEKVAFIGNLENNLLRENKNILISLSGEKFLIPTINLYNYYFPQKEVPQPLEKSKDIPFSNKIIGFPDGVLLTDGKGVFTVSNQKISLIRSPQVFESMGYKWEEVRPMSEFELKINSAKKGDTLDLDFIHPNGTVIKDNGELFLVMNENLYSLTSEEKSKYFAFTPIVETQSKKGYVDCKNRGDKLLCCLKGYDPRINAPSSFPFLNTISFDLTQAEDSQIKKINWKSTIVLNKENSYRRLESLKNYILYTTGIKK